MVHCNRLIVILNIHVVRVKGLELERKTKEEEKVKNKSLSDSMPVNNSSLTEKLVGESNVKNVTNFSPNSWAGKLAVDSHHNVFQAIWLSDHVLHIKLVMPHSSS